MSLSVGTRLVVYKILSALGAGGMGGMGEVYKARDNRGAFLRGSAKSRHSRRMCQSAVHRTHSLWRPDWRLANRQPQVRPAGLTATAASARLDR
jgi:hypothetical protein